MSDETRIIWTDHQGDRIGVDSWDDGEQVLFAESGFDAVLPHPDDKHKLLTELADALGMEWEGLRAKPRPFRKDDVVEHENGGRATVQHVGRYLLFVDDGRSEMAWMADECTLITPAEEVEQQEEAVESHHGTRSRKPTGCAACDAGWSA